MPPPPFQAEVQRGPLTQQLDQHSDSVILLIAHSQALVNILTPPQLGRLKGGKLRRRQHVTRQLLLLLQGCSQGHSARGLLTALPAAAVAAAAAAPARAPLAAGCLAVKAKGIEVEGQVPALL
jgi:hypothetical protein